jgi:excisionase family DNA binding protein
MNKLISVKEVAIRLACSEASIGKWIQVRRLQKVKIGRLTWIKEQDGDEVIWLGLQPKVGLAEGNAVANGGNE